jgi:NAD(P)H-dependent FMN reductase
MHKLMIITVSTREGRKGDSLARWIEGEARQDSEWDVVPVDLKTLALPMLNEPEHPRLKHYRFEHTRQWSALVEPIDAFIVVTPEYNFSAPPSIVNALDYLFQEWAYKPIGFVSYGGVSAGTRGLVVLRQMVSAMRMVPVVESVNVPFFSQFIDAEGTFSANAQTAAGAAGMLAELKKWAAPLKAMRAAGAPKS